jgi:hypothetical protein
VDNNYKNLITLLNAFKNRPNHLSRFLLENKAFTDEFLSKIESNEKLSNINLSKIGDESFYFSNITEMKSFYSSLVEDLELIKSKKDKETLKKDLLELLSKAILNEDYEEAARIRDFMIFNKLK